MNYFRYDFFTIWSSGFPYIDEILSILRNEEPINILRIEKFTIADMQKFVFDLYACDHVPFAHLQSKLAYLFKLSPEIINIFVENHNPQEMPVGKGAFRKVQCKYIVSLKNRIRNQYNPKHSDLSFERAPLDKGVSHEHVVHASDAEEQVDYYLKLLGHNEGLDFFQGDGKGLPFKKPYHIPRPKQFSYKKIPLQKIGASILFTGDTCTIKKFTPIDETPHYIGISQNPDVYSNYVKQFRFTYLKDDHCVENLLQLKSLDKYAIESLAPILVRACDDGFIILDGVHRAAAMKHLGYQTINCVVFES